MLYSYVGAISVSNLTAGCEFSASDISYKCNKFYKKKKGGGEREREMFKFKLDASQIYPYIACEGLTPHCNFKLHRQLHGYYS